MRLRRKVAVVVGAASGATSAAAALAFGGSRPAAVVVATHDATTTTEPAASTTTEATTTTTVVVVPTVPPTTLVLPEDVGAAKTDDEWWAGERDRSTLLACIRSWEGGYATNTGNGYYGAYQFDLTTWPGAVSRAGYPTWASRLPSDAPAHVQDAAAWQLFGERGLQPWPTPQAMC